MHYVCWQSGNRPWCDSCVLQISVLETPLIPEQAPSRADAEGKLTVALVAVLSGAEVTGQLALQAAQTIQQHLQTTPASGTHHHPLFSSLLFLH